MSGETANNPRVHLLDEIRGLCILLMVIYHGAYDLVYIFGVNIPAFHWPILDVAQPFVAGVFIFISGIACRYSHSNLRRGAIALGLGLGISLVTWIFLRDQMIWFGILHFLGTAMLLFGLLRSLLDRLDYRLGAAVCAVLFLLTRSVPQGWLGLRGVAAQPIPAGWYAHRWLLPLGIGGAGADYFPLLPWLFVFLAGAYLGVLFVRERMPAGFYRSHAPWLAAVGRRTIVVYILHQPVVYGVLWLFFRLVR